MSGNADKRKGEMHMKMKKINEFKKICMMPQMELKAWLEKILSKYYGDVVNEDGFLYAKGKDPILLTAHMDTVHMRQCKKITVKKRDGRTILSSKDGIGGDDRCGIYMILRILKETELRPYVLFCEDEEIGGVGSDKFCCTKYSEDLYDLLFFIELDRANDNDLVYYDDINADFHDFCETVTGYKENYGSFSDISHLSPATGVSSVNISCGYYNAHTRDEYVAFEEMENSIVATVKLMKEGISQGVKYDYEEYKPKLDVLSRYWDNYLEEFRRETEARCYEEEPHASNLRHYQFEDVNGNLYDVSECEGFYEAIGKLMFQNPELRWGDVVDYEEYEY